MNITRYLSLLAGAALLLLASEGWAENERDNVHFSGTLVADACVVMPGESGSDILLDFGSVLSKYLYSNGRTIGQAFTIYLTECNPAISDSMRVRFSGAQNTALPGKLALDPDSAAAGVAIGLETMTGDAVPLNDVRAPMIEVVQGEMALQYKAYVQAEPAAIAANGIELGAFKATATFSLEYE